MERKPKQKRTNERLSINWEDITRRLIDFLEMEILGVAYGGAIVGLLVLIMGIAGFFLAFIPGQRSELTDPQLQVAAPTRETPEVVFPNDSVWWDEDIGEWLNSEESQLLRSRENVVNFALLDNGRVYYASGETFVLNEQWTQRRPPFIDAVNVNGTAIEVFVGSRTYSLNVYQPFVESTYPNTVVVIDENSAIWIIPKAEVQLTALEAFTSPIFIHPNNSLTLGYTKEQ